MKYIRTYKIFESKDPIDVEMDIIEFRKKFNQEDDSLDMKLNNMIKDNPTMTDNYQLYQIHNHQNDSEMVVVKAVSAQHAYIKAALKLNKFEIVRHRMIRRNSEKWKCVHISMESIEKQIENAELKLKRLRDIE